MVKEVPDNLLSGYGTIEFSKKSAEGPFDLYSDYESRIKHYKRVAVLAGVLGAINMFTAISDLFIGIENGLTHSVSRTNICVSMLNFTVVALIIPMLVSYLKKIFKMKKEKQLYQ